MNKLILLVACVMAAFNTAMADTFQVHYSIDGAGRDIIVQAESSYDARITVEEMFPNAVVTGVFRKHD